MENNGFLGLPGFDNLINRNALESPIFVVRGGPGTGKSMYGRQFLLEGMEIGDNCILVSSELTERESYAIFSDASSNGKSQFKHIGIGKFISNKFDKSKLFFPQDSVDATFAQVADSNKIETDEPNHSNPADLVNLLESIQHSLALISAERPVSSLGNTDNSRTAASVPFSPKDEHQTRVVFDSINYLLKFFDQRFVIRFLESLSTILHEANAISLITITNTLLVVDNEDKFSTAVASIADGVIELNLVDDNGTLRRNLRLLSIRGHPNSPQWTSFKMDDEGRLMFGNQNSESYIMTCTLCGKGIRGQPIMYLENPFDRVSCLDTFKKLSSIYGPTASPQFGLPSDIINLHFFFIDIVGLSDPSLSVKSQIEKIALLNRLVRACPAYKTTHKDKKIVLPTGDGMAIGFLQNAELPFQLSIQLHNLIRSQASQPSISSPLGIRIGLGSGHVFIHNDINDNQNVWGPGIIFARRVMDLGDNMHILIEGEMAKELLALRDEYRTAINELCDFRIKHGQNIRIYSAYSEEFGNPSLHTKLTQPR